MSKDRGVCKVRVCAENKNEGLGSMKHIRLKRWLEQGRESLAFRFYSALGILQNAN